MKNKQIYLIFFLVVSVLSCKKESDTPNIKHLKSYTAYMIPIKNGQASESSKFIWESKTFNSDSTVKHWDHRINYDFDTVINPLWSEENTYESGILKEKINATVSTRYVYSYSNNQLQNYSVYNEDELLSKDDYKYSNNDDQADTIHHYLKPFDKPTITYVLFYDSNGNMIRDSIIYYSAPYEILTWEYDSHNNMIKETYYLSEYDHSSVQEIRKYVYNTRGNISQCIFSFWPTTYFQKFTYEYLDNGLISQIFVYESTTGIDGNYEQKGILKYEYNYAEK